MLFLLSNVPVLMPGLGSHKLCKPPYATIIKFILVCGEILIASWSRIGIATGCTSITNVFHKNMTTRCNIRHFFIIIGGHMRVCTLNCGRFRTCAANMAMFVNLFCSSQGRHGHHHSKNKNQSKYETASLHIIFHHDKPTCYEHTTFIPLQDSTPHWKHLPQIIFKDCPPDRRNSPIKTVWTPYSQLYSFLRIKF